MKTNTTEYERLKLTERLNRLENSEKNIKCGGVLRKIRRKLRGIK